MIKKRVDAFDNGLLGQIEIYKSKSFTIFYCFEEGLVLPDEICAFGAELAQKIAEFCVWGEEYSFVGFNPQ